MLQDEEDLHGWENLQHLQRTKKKQKRQKEVQEEKEPRRKVSPKSDFWKKVRILLEKIIAILLAVKYDAYHIFWDK